MKAGRKLIQITSVIFIVLITITSLVQFVYADVGPKPSLIITVRGLNTDKYWLDLLVTDEAEYSWLKISDLEKEEVSKLAEYQDKDGFHPALLGGTCVPMRGEIIGEKQGDGNFIHEFNYVGVPRIFKIAILTEDGNLVISDVINRKQFNSIMEYDLSELAIIGSLNESAGIVSEGMSWNDFFIKFLGNMILTLIIEILIAIIMGFTLKKSLKILLVTNVLTQIILNLIVFYFNNNMGIFGIAFGLVIGEFIVLMIEANIYSRLLTEKSKPQRVSYAVTANLISIIGGFIVFFI
jgi:hypothetical protein